MLPSKRNELTSSILERLKQKGMPGAQSQQGAEIPDPFEGMSDGSELATAELPELEESAGSLPGSAISGTNAMPLPKKKKRLPPQMA